MNLGNGKGSVSMVSSGAVCKPAEAVPDQFPAGLRVLVVDDDPTCLTILEMMLKTCLYEVTKCTRAEMALSLLRENRNGYDIVLSDVHMPNMDGFKLLECIGLEMDLPVIMMSADDGKKSVMKGVTLGACDYLIKPVQFEALRNIWQHVVRKKRIEWKDGEQMGSVDEGKRSDDADYSPSSNEGSWKNPRVVWSVELHQQFVQAVNQLGIDKAVPKKILELMNIPGLTRENVACHLQKYRFFLRRLSGVSPHPNSLSNGYMRPQEAAYGSLSSLNGLDLPTRAALGQLPAQSLATLQPARIPGPVVDQRDLFSFDNSKLRFYAQQQQQLLNHTRPVNLPHGIPVNMEPNHYNGSYVLQIPEKNIKHEAPSDRGVYDKSWKISSFSFNSPFVPIRRRTIPPICMVIMVVAVVAVVIAMVRFGLARMWLVGEREKRGNSPLWFFRAFEEC